MLLIHVITKYLRIQGKSLNFKTCIPKTRNILSDTSMDHKLEAAITLKIVEAAITLKIVPS